MDLWDASRPGLGLRVYPSGRMSWIVLVNRQRRKIGTYPHLSLARAWEEARRALGAAQLGKDPFPAEPPPAAALRDLFDDYLRSSRHTEGWHRFLGRTIRRDLAALADLPVDQIRRGDVALLLDDVAARGPVLANRVRAALCSVLSWGVERGYLEHNPVLAVRRPTREQPRGRILNAAELRAVWRALENSRAKAARIAQIVLLTTRRGVAVRSMREQDLDGRWWRIPRDKDGREHLSYLADTAWQIIEGQRDRRRTWVFPAADGGRIDWPWSAMERVVRHSGVQNWGTHDLRRTAITLLAEMGVDRDLRRRIAGHSVRADVHDRVYDLHHYRPQIRSALEALDVRVREIVAS